MAYDFKKEYKDLYQPKQKPMIIDVPKMKFIMVNGEGNPNDEDSSYYKAVGALYALTYTIKMSKMGKEPINGYFDFVVPPLEGLWWFKGDFIEGVVDKDDFLWTSMIRQPDFVTEDVFKWAVETCKKKKPEVDVSKARLESFREGLCVQMLHVGPYDTEPETEKAMAAFMEDEGLKNDISDERKHHEIYLGDPRKTAPEKLRTVLRLPVR